ncbi:MAG: PepSY-associated TM helix domain-containing protein [Gemmatimonadota bacterium]
MRRLVVRLHLWLGLTVGALLAALGLAGSLLVFRDELDRTLNPELLVVAPGAERLPLAELLDRLRAAHPGEPVIRVNLARDADQPHEVWLGPPAERLVYVDPYRGTILGSRLPTSYLMGWLFDFHTHLLTGERGQVVIGIAGAVLLLLSLSGLYVWWPRLGKLTSALTVRRDLGRRRFHFDLHRVSGAVAALFLVVSSVTGLSLVFHEQFMAAFDLATASPPRPITPTSTVRPGAATIPVDSAIAIAVRALPEGTPTYIALPSGAAAPFVVRLRQPSELHPNGRNFVSLDRYSGAVLLVENARTAPAGTRAYNVLYPTHIGRTAGTAGRVVLVFVGFTPLLLFITGMAVWWQRTRGGGMGNAGRAAARRRGHKPNAPPPRGDWRGVGSGSMDPA